MGNSKVLTSGEIWWWTIGRMIGAIRDERHRGHIIVHPRGPFGDFFMRKAGLLQYRSLAQIEAKQGER